MTRICAVCPMVVLAALISGRIAADEPPKDPKALIAKPDLFPALTNPSCSYCSTQHGKGFVKATDRTVAWLRGKHDGCGIPLRHFLARPKQLDGEPEPWIILAVVGN